MGRWEAALLGALFLTQFFFTDREIRLAFAIVYSALAVIVLAVDVPKLPAFARAVRTTVFPAAGVRPH